MSQLRLHEMLGTFFERKGPFLLEGCLADYRFFQSTHGLAIADEEFLKVFTHTSFSHEFNLPHQEQLEFLGDSVLQLILTEELYRRYPSEKEGRLSKQRSAIVNEKSLALIASWLRLGELLLVGRGEFKKRLFEQEAVLADTVEALLAQVYRHHGLEFTRKLLLGWIEVVLPEAFAPGFLDEFDSKSRLQELTLAKYKSLPRYSAEARGDKFEVSLWVNEKLLAQGLFPSKKAGEKELASEVIKKNLI